MGLHQLLDSSASPEFSELHLVLKELFLTMLKRAISGELVSDGT